MIILSILIGIKVLTCIVLIALIIEIKRQGKHERQMPQSMIDKLFENYWECDSKATNNARDIRDIKDSIVGYEFALKTFEDYMKAKLEDKP